MLFSMPVSKLTKIEEHLNKLYDIEEDPAKIYQLQKEFLYGVFIGLTEL